MQTLRGALICIINVIQICKHHKVGKTCFFFAYSHDSSINVEKINAEQGKLYSGFFSMRSLKGRQQQRIQVLPVRFIWLLHHHPFPLAPFFTPWCTLDRASSSSSSSSCLIPSILSFSRPSYLCSCKAATKLINNANECEWRIVLNMLSTHLSISSILKWLLTAWQQYVIIIIPNTSTTHFLLFNQHKRLQM